MCFKPHLYSIQSHIIIMCTLRTICTGRVKMLDAKDNKASKTNIFIVDKTSDIKSKKY